MKESVIPCQFWTDFMNLFQFYLWRIRNALHGSKVFGQNLCGSLAHMPDTETEDDAPEFERTALADFLNEIFCRLPAHAIEALEPLGR